MLTYRKLKTVLDTMTDAQLEKQVFINTDISNFTGIDLVWDGEPARSVYNADDEIYPESDRYRDFGPPDPDQLWLECTD